MSSLPTDANTGEGRGAGVDAPRVQLGPTGAQLYGRWTSEALSEATNVARCQTQLQHARQAPHWDLRGVAQMDHVGAQLLWSHWGGRWPGACELGDATRATLERVARYTVPPVPAPARTVLDRLRDFGTVVLHAWRHGVQFTRLVGQLAINLVRLVRAPAGGPWRDVSGHLYRMGATALPITALVGFLIGVVLAYLTSQQLRQFGADTFIVNILGVALIRELGPMLAAILIAGRSGSAITAQIGVMRVTDELDAMRVMGISHHWRLVLPRALALGLALPLLSIWTTVAALSGGMFAALLALDVTPTYFLLTLPDAVAVQNLLLASVKSAVFGVLIALIGCHWGLRVKPNTQSLGEGTTASVVTSITAVILVDALFAVLFKDVGI